MKTIHAAVLLLITLALSCTTIRADLPAGFALVRESAIYKAVSPEGLLYKIRYTANYPEKELAFWAEALKHQLGEEGYLFIGEGEFATAKGAGWYFEWGAPYGSQNYIYLTALFVAGKKIVIAEAAGEYKLYQRYRDALLASLPTIGLK